MRLALLIAFASLLALGLHQTESEYSYDEPDRSIASTSLGGEEAYDGDVLVLEEETLATYLRFVPGQGDVLSVKLGAEVEHITSERRYANPKLTSTVDGAVWLTYEAREESSLNWNVYARKIVDGTVSEAIAIGDPDNNNINHDAASPPRGGLWCVWQAEDGGQFDVLSRMVPEGDARTGSVTLSSSPYGDWQPRIAFTPNGWAWIVWDSFDGVSFNVCGRRHEGDYWSKVEELVASPAFEGRASIASDSKGRVYVAWEEGAENWGREYRSVSTQWNNVTDANGPLHRLRRVWLGEWAVDSGCVGVDWPLPMPSLARARAETRRHGVSDLGVFYERAEVAVDGRDRPWVAYRHYVELQLGRDEPVKHHIEQGWNVFARCLTDCGWGPLIGFDRAQRDGSQRLSLSPGTDGITALWTTGRTDRRTDERERGLAMATVELGRGDPPPRRRIDSQPRVFQGVRAELPEPPAPELVNEVNYGVFFGDLHRHTDLSLCFPFFDGSLDDAYRYGIEVARLDFLGVTDHARDIDQGDVQSQLWWRSTKAVERHRIGTTFTPYFAYERSQGATDHNVISLRDDMLRPHKPPLPEFWAEIDDGNTITIPHNTVPDNPFCGKVWSWHDDAKRPLVEVYQGCRDRSVDVEAQVGLEKGYHMGFIASSDHLSTSGSYACVWSPSAEREAIFRSMQARRTYGATARIRLVTRMGDAWMGERVVAQEWSAISVEIDGTAKIATVELIRDGEVVERAEPGTKHFTGRLGDEATIREGEESWAYVRVVQDDGNSAWSSPIWVRTVE